jgi:hypothetical protein
MTTKEYIIAKNKLIKKHTGLTLVPEDQIIDLPFKKLYIYTDESACPYCIHFECHDCPMHKANNSCGSITGTYWTVTDYAEDFLGCLGEVLVDTEAPWHEELKQLIKDYNASNL